MRYLRGLALAAVAVALLAGTGCVTKQVYDRDIQVERGKTAKALKDLDMAKRDLKKANDTVASLSQKAAELTTVQEQLAGERKRAEESTAAVRTEVENARKAQEHADQEKIQRLTTNNRNETTQLTKAREQIAKLEKEIERLKKEKPAPAPEPRRVMPPVTPPVTPAPAPG